jgi:hypothetical protein
MMEESTSRVIEIQTGKELAEVSLAQSAMMDLNTFDKDMGELKKEWEGFTADAATPLGMAKLKQGRAAVRDVRYRVPKIVDKTTKELNALKKAVQVRGEEIEAELHGIEDPMHDQIIAEENRKAEIAVGKERERAERQAELDAMIMNIIKLPLTVVGKSAKEIGEFQSVIEPQEFGAEFQGETLARAKSAKEQALIEIRHLHAQAIVAEENAAKIKAEQEAAELRLGEEKKERDRLAAIEREEMAKREAEAAEQKRLNDIEAARLKKLADEEAEKLRLEREAFEAEQTEARRVQKEAEDRAAAERAEADRIAKEKGDAEVAEKKRIQDEADEKARKEAHAAAVKAEKERKEAEAKAKAAEKALKLVAAKCASATEAFKKILGYCESRPADALDQIALIAEANL